VSGPQEYAARHARDPFEALPHGGSIFDAPDAGIVYAVARARSLVAEFKAAQANGLFDDPAGSAGWDGWVGQAAAVLEELTRDG
jgi:hypothetical protein